MPQTRASAILGAPIRGLKALTQAIFATAQSWGVMFGQQAVVQRKVGDGGENSIVVATLGWLQRNFTQAPIRVRQRDADDMLTPVLPGEQGAGRMLSLLDEPNPAYDWGALSKATVLSYVLDGNAYWQVIRNGMGMPIAYWWIPHTLIEPKRDEGSLEFITHYDYQPGGGIPVRLGLDDVVHFRDGLDPTNPMKGMSRVKAVLREVFTDEEAAAYTSTLLTNMGVPGIVVSPEPDAAGMGGVPGDDELAGVKAKFEQATTGGNRGRTIVMRGATRLQTFGFNPQQMNLRDLRRVPEERITAAIGVPAIVAGMGAGLDKATFANFGEARETAVEEALIPLWGDFARVIQKRIMPDFVGKLRRQMVVDFDLSEVRVLKEDQDKIADRMERLVTAGIAKVSEAREKLGLSVEDEHDIYLRPLNLIEVPSGPEAEETEQPDRTLEYRLVSLVNAGVITPNTANERLGYPPVPGGDELRVPETAAPAATSAEKHAARALAQRMKAAGVAPPAKPSTGVEVVAANAAEVKRLSRRQQAALIVALEQDQQALTSAFASRLEKRFGELGARAVEAWQAQGVEIAPVPQVEKGLKAGDETVLAPHEAAAAKAAVAAAEVDEWTQKVMTPEYARHYEAVARRTLSTLTSNLGIEIGDPDSVAVTVLEQHGKQIGLLDLSSQTREAMFQALADGKAAGEGPPAIERRIREYVTNGSRGSNVSARATRIARTETMHAQRVSTRTAYQASGVFDTVVAFDDRLGYGDPDCVARNGETYTFEQAEQEELLEHPNGTLSWAPGSVRD